MKKISFLAVLMTFLGAMSPYAFTAEICSPAEIENFFTNNTTARGQVMERSNEIFQFQTQACFEDLCYEFANDIDGLKIESVLREPFKGQNEDYRYKDGSGLTNPWYADFFDQEIYALVSTPIDLGFIRVYEKIPEDGVTMQVNVIHAAFIDQNQANHLTAQNQTSLATMEGLEANECIFFVDSALTLDLVSDCGCFDRMYTHMEDCECADPLTRKLKTQYGLVYNKKTKTLKDGFSIPEQTLVNTLLRELLLEEQNQK